MNKDKKFKEKIVSHSIIETSRVFKRLSALIIFLSFFALSLIVLFRIGDISFKTEVIQKYAWLVEILLSLWFAARVAISNIKKAYFSMYASYTLGAALIIYSALMVHFTIDYQPTDWLDLKKLFIWFAPILGVNTLWKIIFVILEYRVRPFFARKMVYSAIQNIITMGLLWILTILFQTYAIDKKPIDMDDAEQMAFIFSGIIGLLAIGILVYIQTTKYWKYSEYGRSATRKTILWHSLMRLGSITVWFVARDVYMHQDMKWWILTSIAGGLLALLVIFAFSKKHGGGKSKVYTFLATTTIATLGIGMFIMEEWWGANSLDLLPIVLVTYTAIYMLNIIVEPSTTWWVSKSYANVAATIAAYVLVDWVFGDYFGSKMTNLPFSINELIAIPFLIGITVLEGASIASAWRRYNTISRSASAILKIQNEKGVKHE